MGCRLDSVFFGFVNGPHTNEERTGAALHYNPINVGASSTQRSGGNTKAIAATARMAEKCAVRLELILPQVLRYGSYRGTARACSFPLVVIHTASCGVGEYLVRSLHSSEYLWAGSSGAYSVSWQLVRVQGSGTSKICRADFWSTGIRRNP